MNTESYWSKSAEIPRFGKLERNLKVDAVVIGGGITGVTAAYLLAKAGHRVALVERGRCGGFDSSNTTAHLTCVTDERLHELAGSFGKDGAKAAWEAGRAAIDRIFDNIRAEEIECEFRWIPGYLHVPFGAEAKEKENKALREDADLAREFGFGAEFMPAVPLMGQPGVKFANQAKFHPLKYLAGLLRAMTALVS